MKLAGMGTIMMIALPMPLSFSWCQSQLPLLHTIDLPLALLAGAFTIIAPEAYRNMKGTKNKLT